MTDERTLDDIAAEAGEQRSERKGCILIPSTRTVITYVGTAALAVAAATGVDVQAVVDTALPYVQNPELLEAYAQLDALVPESLEPTANAVGTVGTYAALFSLPFVGAIARGFWAIPDKWNTYRGAYGLGAGASATLSLKRAVSRGEKDPSEKRGILNRLRWAGRMLRAGTLGAILGMSAKTAYHSVPRLGKAALVTGAGAASGVAAGVGYQIYQASQVLM